MSSGETLQPDCCMECGRDLNRRGVCKCGMDYSGFHFGHSEKRRKEKKYKDWRMPEKGSHVGGF